MCTAHFAYVHKIFHQLPTTLFMFNRIIVVYIPAIPLYMSTHLRPFISVPNLLQLKSASFIVIHIRHQAILSSLTLPCNSEVPSNSLEASIDCCWSISAVHEAWWTSPLLRNFAFYNMGPRIESRMLSFLSRFIYHALTYARAHLGSCMSPSATADVFNLRHRLLHSDSFEQILQNLAQLSKITVCVFRLAWHYLRFAVSC